MEILYVSSVMAKTLNEKIKNQLKQPTEHSIQKFHSLLLDGLNFNEDVNIRVLSGLPISRKHSNKLVWGRTHIVDDNIDYIHLPFLNIPVMKQLLICIGMFVEMIRWSITKEEKYIICDAAYATVTPIIMFWAKLFQIKTIAIVADIYDYMSDEIKKEKRSLVRFISRKISKWTLKNYSGYILLTQAMNSIVNKNNKPYIIMEGVVDATAKQIDNTLDNKYRDKVCIYAGGLHEKYGIKKLVEAFIKIQDKEARLYLYGTGDLKEYLEKLKNDKIVYFGSMDNKKVVEEEKKATLLVNPRFSNEEYTKYSFPSKIMEYMLSGTPVLTTKLPGIPKEYDEYLWYIKEETTEGIEKAINELISKDKKELLEKGKEAQKFVLENKNNVMQAKRILEFIKSAL